MKRESFDKIFKSRAARAERFTALNSQRKGFAADLAAREEAFKKARTEERQAAASERAELERLKAEGERMRREREQRAEDSSKALQEEEDRRVAEERAKQDALGPLDTTVRIKWPRKLFPRLELDADAVLALLPPQASINVDSVVLSGKMADNPKLKYGTALVALKTVTAAVKTVEAAGKGKLEGIEVSWAGGKEPEIVRRQRESEAMASSKSKRRSEAEQPDPVAREPKIPKLNEDSVLDQLRARERERERLEEEIRQQDEADEAAAAA